MLELYGDERYQCRTGVLSFVEPTNQGKIKEEEFVVSQTEIEALKTELIAIVKDIGDKQWPTWPLPVSDSPYAQLAKNLVSGQG